MSILVLAVTIILFIYLNEGETTFEDINKDLIEYNEQYGDKYCVNGIPNGVSDEDKAIINQIRNK